MVTTASKPTHTVPAAKIRFDESDRAWILERIDEVLGSGQLTLGKYGAAFEESFARLCGVRHAVAVNSGTSALEISLRALGVEGRDVLGRPLKVWSRGELVVDGGTVLAAPGRGRFVGDR